MAIMPRDWVDWGVFGDHFRPTQTESLWLTTMQIASQEG